MDKNYNSDTVKKYLALLKIIATMENRLSWSEFIYSFLNIIVLFFIIGLTFYLTDNQRQIPFFIWSISPLLCIVVGETLCVYWVISSMRIQLKLKLRYFQARGLERKMNSIGEYIISEEFIFFDSNIKVIESFDKKETVEYPSTGTVRMDGFAGSVKPRHLSWILPVLFFLIYCIFFIWTVLQVIAI
ncbi:MAG: hypothetical protein AB1480_06660 [Nitrospirota bacterium]